MTVLGLPPGNLAEWVGGVGTILAFGATSAAIWQGHRLRLKEHRDTMYDQALLVTMDVSGGSLHLAQPDGTKVPTNAVNVTVQNRGRRAINRVIADVYNPAGDKLIGTDRADLVQSGSFWPCQIPVGSRTALQGFGTGLGVRVLLQFDDVDGTHWRRTYPDGVMLGIKQWRSWQPWARRKRFLGNLPLRGQFLPGSSSPATPPEE